MIALNLTTTVVKQTGLIKRRYNMFLLICFMFIPILFAGTYQIGAGTQHVFTLEFYLVEEKDYMHIFTSFDTILIV